MWNNSSNNMKKSEIVKKRIHEIQTIMSDKNIDVYYIPTEDFHGSEFVSDYFKTREYMSGFTGSAGTLIITNQSAGLFTDGRYFLQAEKELENTGIDLYKMGNEGVPTIEEFLGQNLQDKMTLAFDGRCVSAGFAISLQKYFQRQGKNITFQCDEDLVSQLWKDRPALPDSKPYVLPECYCGETITEKINRVRMEMRKRNAKSFLLTSLDDIAWLLNIRGNDIECSPLVLSNMMITEDEVIFYCGSCKKPDEKTQYIDDYLRKNRIQMKGYFEIYDDVRTIAEKLPVILDLDKVNFKLYSDIKNTVNLGNDEYAIIDIINPTTVFKAIKNPTEIANEKNAHIKDAIAYIRFLFWFKRQCDTKKITEKDIAEKLLEERKKMEGFVSESFNPIVAYGEHGAIVHYAFDEFSNAKLDDQSFVLIDTGGHYLEGTTDITRTLACGELSCEEKENYTLVLKGNLALGNAVFLEGTTGAGLDFLARQPLWKNFLDYKHGTGHGVGYFLNVHEGPNSIRSKIGKGKNISAEMKPGMITSNEPGLYLAGKYGIRIENMTVCKEKTKNEFGRFLEFETLTMVPYELEAIDIDLLDDIERTLINEYHNQVYLTLKEYLSEEEQIFLKEITQRI
ncbi:MAG: aminopeptidase P family protein [Lachnospiraceae bacterium]|nr:aminopeptidase P family protein [Lachnospiraceae bacterium]